MFVTIIIISYHRFIIRSIPVLLRIRFLSRKSFIKRILVWASMRYEKFVQTGNASIRVSLKINYLRIRYFKNLSNNNTFYNDQEKKSEILFGLLYNGIIKISINTILSIQIIKWSYWWCYILNPYLNTYYKLDYL